MAAAEARDGEANAVIEMILKLDVSGDHGRRGKEPIFCSEPPKTRSRWRRRRRPAAEVRTGWRIGCYYRLASETLPGGYRIKSEFPHPVYLLSDGRLAVGALRAIDAEGKVTELRPQRSHQRPWFTPLEDNHAFFAVRPGHYLDELKALLDDLA